jgi:hypothetical protein
MNPAGSELLLALRHALVAFRAAPMLLGGIATGDSLAVDVRVPRPSGRLLSPFEFWPDWLFYAPVALQWAALALRYRSLTLPTAANPGISAGGLVGESKTEILDLVRGEARGLIAPYASFVVAGDAALDRTAARAAMAGASLAFPLVAKPDLGCNGTGVRVVADEAELAAWLQAFPSGERAILQTLLTEEGEAGLFYIREPGAPAGRVTSITLKYAPEVVGDGVATLETLIRRDQRAGRLAHLYLPRLAGRLEEVPPSGERVRLVFTGNHVKGAIFRDGCDHATPALAAAVERVASAIPDFHFGRLDVRFRSIAGLRRGEGFRIIEINGAGSEATHVWDPDMTLRRAWAAELAHFGAAWRIGAANRARGARTTSVFELWRLWRRHKRLMARYPMNS